MSRDNKGLIYDTLKLIRIEEFKKSLTPDELTVFLRWLEVILLNSRGEADLDELMRLNFALGKGSRNIPDHVARYFVILMDTREKTIQTTIKQIKRKYKPVDTYFDADF